MAYKNIYKHQNNYNLSNIIISSDGKCLIDW